MTPAEYNRYLPCPGDYARSWRTLASMERTKLVRVPGWVVGMGGCHDQTVPAGLALDHIRKAADNRINARAGYTPREPREGYWPLYRDAVALKEIRTRRLRVYQFETRQARARFSHLLARHDD